jgi:hypothetical protein
MLSDNAIRRIDGIGFLNATKSKLLWTIISNASLT